MYDTYRELAEQNLYALPEGDVEVDKLTIDRGQAWAMLSLASAIHELAESRNQR